MTQIQFEWWPIWLVRLIRWIIRMFRSGHGRAVSEVISGGVLVLLGLILWSGPGILMVAVGVVVLRHGYGGIPKGEREFYV